MVPERHSVCGKNVLRIYRTDRFKSGLLSVTATLPITEENACYAPLMLSVLRRGTERYPTLSSLNLRLDYLFGTALALRCSYRGDRLVIGFSADLLDGSYLPAGTEPLAESVAEILGELLFHPLLENGTFAARYVESEKELQIDAIRSLKSNPRKYAAERCLGLMFQGEPRGITLYGTEEQVRAITKESLTDYWKRWISDLAVECFYVGAAEPETIGASLDRLFGTHPIRGSAIPQPQTKKPAGEVRREEETMPVSQGHLMIGFRSDILPGSAEFYAAVVYNELLGCSPIARLFMNVREKLSLCYSCSSVYNTQMGSLLVSCGLAVPNRRAAEEEIFRQIDELRAGRFTDAELDAAKKSLVNACRQVEDSPSAIESFYSARTGARQAESLTDYIERLEAVTKDEVTAAANRFLADTVYFLEGTLAGEEETDDDDGI